MNFIATLSYIASLNCGISPPFPHPPPRPRQSSCSLAAPGITASADDLLPREMFAASASGVQHALNICPDPGAVHI